MQMRKILSNVIKTCLLLTVKCWEYAKWGEGRVWRKFGAKFVQRKFGQKPVAAAVFFPLEIKINILAYLTVILYGKKRNSELFMTVLNFI
jgi:hypothetical protein